jgi:hypothetical protein
MDKPIPEAMVDALYDELFRVGAYLHAPVPIDPKEIIRRHLAAAQQQGGGDVVCPECYGEGGRRWYEADGSERGERCGTCGGFGHIAAPPSAPVGVKTLSEFMAEQEALHPGIHDKVQAAADELRASLAQQPAAVDEAGGFDANFLRSVANLCRAAYDLCQPKPQRTPEDVREHYGELCLSGLVSIADEIERRLAEAEAVKPAAVDEAAAIRAFEEHFEASAEDPSFEGELELWLTAWRKALDSAPQQPAAVDEATRLLRAYRGAPKFSNDHNAIKQTCALEDEIDLFLATQQQEKSCN